MRSRRRRRRHHRPQLDHDSTSTANRRRREGGGLRAESSNRTVRRDRELHWVTTSLIEEKDLDLVRLLHWNKFEKFKRARAYQRILKGLQLKPSRSSRGKTRRRMKPAARRELEAVELRANN
jgi:hypothetical protein